jgi:hypothetical protein
MSKGLKIAEPPRRPTEAAAETAPAAPQAPAVTEKFSQVRAGDKVQFNKRIESHVADGYEMLAIRTKRRVPELLAEGLALLEERYGRI